MPNFALAIMPLPFTNQPEETIQGMVDALVDDVIKGLTTTLATTEPIKEIVTFPEEVLSFEGADLLDAWANMNRSFLEYAWSDGFPLVAPTSQAVDAMLEGTSRSRYDIIATLEPGFGIATVEKIAINAVMAGCRPGVL